MARLCVALDLADAPALERMALDTQDHAGMFKVGLTTIYGAGPRVVRALSAQRPVFVDAKLHDIPAQVEGAVDRISALGADCVSVHAAGGADMVKAAAAAARGRCKVLAVTVLTSLDDGELRRIGIEAGVTTQVERLADVALESGADGIVCSALEVASLRDRYGASQRGGPVLVVPGVRPADSARDDQRRSLTPREAVANGADVVVIGRPITAAADPRAAARRFAEEIGA